MLQCCLCPDAICVYLVLDTALWEVRGKQHLQSPGNWLQMLREEEEEGGDQWMGVYLGQTLLGATSRGQVKCQWGFK